MILQQLNNNICELVSNKPLVSLEYHLFFPITDEWESKYHLSSKTWRSYLVVDYVTTGCKCFETKKYLNVKLLNNIWK